MSPCLFNLYAEYMIQNARLDEAQAGIKIARRNINNIISHVGELKEKIDRQIVVRKNAGVSRVEII